MSKTVNAGRLVPFIIVAGVVAAAVALGPAAVELRRRAKCCGNLQSLVRMLGEEASKSDAMSAEEAVAALVDRWVIGREATVCPVGGRPYQFALLQFEPEREVDTRAVLAFESPENHGGDGACVMFVDGHAEFVDVERFRALISESSRP